MNEIADIIQKIFVNREGELRCGWRIAAFIVLFVLAAILMSGFLSTLVLLVPSLKFLLVSPPDSEQLSGRKLISLLVSQLSNLIAWVLATAVSAILLERRNFGSVGFKLHRGWLRDSALGVLLGSATLSMAVALIKSAGSVSFERGHAGAAQSFLPTAAVVLLFFLMAAAVEELMFRGFPFQALAHNIGPAWAVAVTSSIFGLAHLTNSGATALSTVNTVLAGVWLGLAYLRTRSLWLATALHFSWNFVMVFVFGLPVSGLATMQGQALLRGIPGSPDWISGGSYGPEGGSAATLALIASTLVLWKGGLFAPSEDMLNAIKHGTSEPGRISIADHLNADMDDRSAEG